MKANELKNYIKIGTLERRIKSLERDSKFHASCINMMGTQIGELSKKVNAKDFKDTLNETYPEFIKKHYAQKEK